MRAGFVIAFAVPVGCAMAFPSSINSDVQVFIDMQASDRRARAELGEVFASDPVYHDLSVSSVHQKVVCITVRGSLNTRADLDRLRSRLTQRCPALRECFLRWDVSLRDTRERVSGLDQYLFQDAEPSAVPDPAGG